MAKSPLTARSAFAGLLVAVGNGRGISALDRGGLGLATVAVRAGQVETLALAVRECFALELPRGATRCAAGAFAFAGTAPGAWLASKERGENEFPDVLRLAVGRSASVTDQSDGYGILRVQGPRARCVLAKLVPLDLHPRAFAIGACASTVASHMGVILWRLEDICGSPVFELAVFRSLAESFWRALSEGAAEYGLAVEAAADSK